MTEYTPTTDDVRADYAYTSDTGEPDPAYEAAFNRWLAAHDRTTAAKALREAAGAMNTEVMDPWDWLRNEADRIEQGGDGK